MFDDQTIIREQIIKTVMFKLLRVETKKKLFVNTSSTFQQSNYTEYQPFFWQWFPQSFSVFLYTHIFYHL